MNVAARRSHGFWASLIAWANFILLIMAVIKFIPLMMSLSCGLDLAPEQIAKGLGHERAWAPYLFPFF